MSSRQRGGTYRECAKSERTPVQPRDLAVENQRQACQPQYATVRTGLNRVSTDGQAQDHQHRDKAVDTARLTGNEYVQKHEQRGHAEECRQPRRPFGVSKPGYTCANEEMGQGGIEIHASCEGRHNLTIRRSAGGR